MDDDFVKLLREQERILGKIQDGLLGWMDNLLREALDPESFFRYAASLGIVMPSNLEPERRDIEADAYRVLGLDQGAADAEVRSRYRELLKKLHPDTAGVPGTEYLLKLVIAAYQQIAKERKWNQ